MTDLEKLKQRIEEDEHIHRDELSGAGVNIWTAQWVGGHISTPSQCVYCNAEWSPEMIEMVEVSGYCETCADSERVIDVFCSSCTRLVYRKEI